MNVLQLITNFSKEFATFAKKGMPLVSKPVYKERIEACETCPHRKNLKCGLCGCVIAVKARMETTNCPDNPSRWSEISKK
tara:strand:+ start:2261 stop:2500 length:240 start_codon:yes stop_codon:yes gene_type:complete